jgi:hypothetical protein
LGKALAAAFQIGQPQSSGALHLQEGGHSQPVASRDLNRPQRFSAETAPGSETIVLRLLAPNGNIEVALSVSEIESIFETIGKALTLAKSLEFPITRQ